MLLPYQTQVLLDFLAKPDLCANWVEKYSKLHELSDDVVTAIEGDTGPPTCLSTDSPAETVGMKRFSWLTRVSFALLQDFRG